MADQAGRVPHSRGARRRARYREIARILWEERLLDLFRGTGLEGDLPTGTAGGGPPETTKGRDQALPVRVRRALERLGPVYIKIGQLLATRGDLVPPAFLEELAKLQDDVPAEPWPAMKEVIQAELGGPLEELFGSFEETPLAAASIGQVYRATLSDGTPVAVKVQRPGVSEAMDLDLDIVHGLADRLAAHVQGARDFGLTSLAEELSAILRAELDYNREGRSLDRFRSAFEDDHAVVFPRVYWEHTTSRVLTMDLLEGVPGTILAEGKRVEGVDAAQMVRTGVGAYFHMIFEMGFYHADPHAGNLFALPGGRLGFVDCGRVATVTERNRQAVFDILTAVLDDDPVGVTESALAATGMPPHVDLAALEIDITGLLAEYRRQQSEGQGLGNLMQGLLRVMRVHRLRVPGELTTLLVTLGVLDGVARQLDPDFRMMEVAKPFARKLMPEQYGPERFISGARRSARAYLRFFDELPVNATRALRRVGTGEFRVAVRPDNFEALADRLTAGVYLLAYAIIVGALIVGFGFIVGRQELTQPEQVGYRIVLFAAMASVIWLLIRSVHSEWRKSQAHGRSR